LTVIEGARHTFASARPNAEKLPRPLTHDLLSQTLDALGADVDTIVIRYVPSDRVFTAEVLLSDDRSPVGASIDARPSDALALAVRRDPTPAILAESSLLQDEVSST
jgi:bifunctional DNase/RNase